MLTRAGAAAEVMEHLCAHSAHGYSQPHRQGVGTGGAVGETVTLSDGERVGVASGDRDCSSACVECYVAVGVSCGGAHSTRDMRRLMTSTGNFRWHPRGTYSARRGDVYLREGRHAAMCLGGGRLGEFWIAETGGIDGARGDQTGGEGRVRSYYDYPWDGVLEYVGPERKEPDKVKEVKDAVYRLYNPNAGAHHFTASHAEANFLASGGWEYEGVGFRCAASGTQVYRLYNPNSGAHMYTASASEAIELACAGWSVEGHAWRAPTDGADVLRLYNPNSGEHMFTTSSAERDSLVRAGWADEGVAFKG